MPADLDRRHIPALLRSRALRLRNGEAEQLWNEHAWLATEPSTAISAVQPSEYGKKVIATAKWGSVARVFGSITKIPFAPNTATVEKLLLKKITTTPNPIFETRAARTAELLPPPTGRATYVSLEAAAERVQHWTRRLGRMNERTWRPRRHRHARLAPHLLHSSFHTPSFSSHGPP